MMPKRTLPSFRNQDLKTVKVETEKTNELLTHISKNNIAELHEPIYAGAKSSSSCHTACTNLPDPLLPHLSIVHCPRDVFKVISCIGTESLSIGSCWLSCLCSSI